MASLKPRSQFPSRIHQIQFSFIAVTSYDRQDEHRLQIKAKISINPDQWVTLTDGTGGWVNSTFLEPSDVSLDTSILRERLGDTPVSAVSFKLERRDNKYPCGQHNGPCCSLQHIKVLRKLANVMQTSPPPQETYVILDPPDAAREFSSVHQDQWCGSSQLDSSKAHQFEMSDPDKTVTINLGVVHRVVGFIVKARP